LENYFDPYFDSTLTYNEYSPTGEIHWTQRKFNEKTKNIYKVLQAISSWEDITLLGVCEIENKMVLNHLLTKTPLKLKSYKFIHYNSNDARGIDVALIYAEDFSPVFSTIFSVVDISGDKIPSRDILYVKGFIDSVELHVFINHWTSRYRGLMESNGLRMEFAKLLRSKTDSLFNLNKNTNIIIMGDFNDQPFDASMQYLTEDTNLVNIYPKSLNKNASGTVKFQSVWYTFDQIILSNSLLNDESKIILSKDEVKIFDPVFLLENDKKFLGVKPFRTNIGYTYHGGFSDHLPVFVDLIERY